MDSAFYHVDPEKRVAWVTISMHACHPVPIVMVLYLTLYGPLGHQSSPSKSWSSGGLAAKSVRERKLFVHHLYLNIFCKRKNPALLGTSSYDQITVTIYSFLRKMV